MIVEFRKKPSRARRLAAQKEKDAELDRIVKEELRRAWFAFEPPNEPPLAVEMFREQRVSPVQIPAEVFEIKDF